MARTIKGLFPQLAAALATGNEVVIDGARELEGALASLSLTSRRVCHEDRIGNADVRSLGSGRQFGNDVLADDHEANSANGGVEDTLFESGFLERNVKPSCH